jgi:hypothetical protein
LKTHHHDLCRALLGCGSLLRCNLSFGVVCLSHVDITTSLGGFRLFGLVGWSARFSDIVLKPLAEVLTAIWASVWCGSRASTSRPAFPALAFLAAIWASNEAELIFAIKLERYSQRLASVVASLDLSAWSKGSQESIIFILFDLVLCQISTSLSRLSLLGSNLCFLKPKDLAS